MNMKNKTMNKMTVLALVCSLLLTSFGYAMLPPKQVSAASASVPPLLITEVMPSNNNAYTFVEHEIGK
jgi:hypothetical protein